MTLLTVNGDIRPEKVFFKVVIERQTNWLSICPSSFPKWFCARLGADKETEHELWVNFTGNCKCFGRRVHTCNSCLHCRYLTFLPHTVLLLYRHLFTRWFKYVTNKICLSQQLTISFSFTPFHKNLVSSLSYLNCAPICVISSFEGSKWAQWSVQMSNKYKVINRFN